MKILAIFLSLITSAAIALPYDISGRIEVAHEVSTKEEIETSDVYLSLSKGWDIDGFRSFDVRFSTGATLDFDASKSKLNNRHKISVGFNF